MTSRTFSLHCFLWLALTSLVLAGCKNGPAPQTNSSPPANTATATPATVEKRALSGKVDSVSLYPVPNNPQNLAISVVVSVSNSGPATHAVEWTLAVNTPGSRDLRGIQPVHVNGVVAMPGTGQRVDLDKEDLMIKSKDTEIAKSATLTGILTFVLPKLSAANLSNNNSSLLINFKDSQGNSYQSGRAMIGAKR